MQIEPSREYKFEGIKYTREIAASFKGNHLDPLKEAALSAACRRSGAEAVKVTVTDTGKHNIYYVTCKVDGGTEERIAFVLRPEEQETGSIKTGKSAPSA